MFKFNNFDIHFKELLRGASVAFIFKILSAAIAFSFNIILARNLGVEETGVYFLALSIVVFLAAIGRLGMELVLVRQIAMNVETQHPEKVMGIYNVAIKYTLIFSLFLSFMLYILTPQISLVFFSKPDLERPLTIMSLAVVPIVLIILHGHALQGLKKIASSMIVSGLIVPLVTSILVIVFVKNYGIDAVIWGYLISSIIAAIIGRRLWVKYTNKFRHYQPMFDAKLAFNSSRPLLGIVIMNMVVNMSPIFLLGVWVSAEKIGIYGVASRVAMLTSFILMAVNSISAPKFAELYRLNKIKQLEKLARKSTELMIYMSTPAFLLFIILPEFTLSMFGEGFESGSAVLIILSIGQFVNISTGSVGYLLNMSGYETVMFRIHLFCAALGLMLSLFLIPLNGIIGASISVTLTLSIQNFIATVFVWKKIGIKVFPWFYSKK